MTMGQVMKIIHPVNALELNQHMIQVRMSIEKTQGKNVVLIIGAVDGGKPIFIQSCLGYKHIRAKNSDGTRCIQIDGEMSPEHIKLKKNHLN